MSSNGAKPAKVRARLNHPVIDTDQESPRDHGQPGRWVSRKDVK